MSDLVVHGLGAVSPAGWGVEAMRQAVLGAQPLPTQAVPRPGWAQPLRVRRVPLPSPRPAFLAHPRLRRTSPITHFVVAAALEALGDDLEPVQSGALRLGVLFTTMIGCVHYSRRFFDETLKDPTTASPLVFPETVFNAPASHLAAFLGTRAINCTLVGDPGTFLQGVATAADWLLQDRVDGCLVIGAEEADWLVADAYRLFSRQVVLSEGAGALYLRACATAGSLVRLARSRIRSSSSVSAIALRPCGVFGRNCQPAARRNSCATAGSGSVVSMRRNTRPGRTGPVHAFPRRRSLAKV